MDPDRIAAGRTPGGAGLDSEMTSPGQDLPEFKSPPVIESADTVGGYVVYIGDEAEELLESPSIIAIWPERHTFRFRSGRPTRRVSARLPFISSASFLEDA